MIDNAKISTKLSAAFGLLVVFLLGIVALALVQMAGMRAGTQVITGNWLPSVELVNKMNTNTSDYRIAEVGHILSVSDADMVAMEKDMDAVRAQFDDNNRRYKTLISSDQERALYESFMSDWNEYQKLHHQIIALSKNNQNEEAKAILDNQSRQLFDRSSASLLKLVDLNSAGARQAADESESRYAMARNTMLLVAAAAAVLAVVASWLLVRTITVPLRYAVDMADRVAQGDLTAKIASASQDETGQLLRALQRMQQGLVNIVADVRSSSHLIVAGSEQIASGNANLSSRTEEQAASLEETAASMEELTTTVKQNADNSHQASALAKGASSIAGQGREVFMQVVGTMRNISDSSQKIASIISVIDSIAFQTNILALNAAVEAARAGE